MNELIQLCTVILVGVPAVFGIWLISYLHRTFISPHAEFYAQPTCDEHETMHLNR